MKSLFGMLLLLGCNKDPIKPRCYTVTNVQVLSFTPDVYRVTFVSGRFTVKVETKKKGK